MNTRSAAIIVAGGAGKRFGGALPKQFLPLCGKPLFLWSVLAFKKVREFRDIIVVVPEDRLATLAPLGKKYSITFVAGGKERIDSVKAGLALVPADAAYIAIHDGARPLISPNLIRKVLAAAVAYKAALPAVSARDTIKLAGRSLVVKATVPRDEVWGAQTPQIFERKLIMRAYRKLGRRAVTDDAQVAELAGYRVQIVPGERENIKITEPFDLFLAKHYRKMKE